MAVMNPFTKSLADRVSTRLLGRPSTFDVGDFYVGGNHGLGYLLGRAAKNPIVQSALGFLYGYAAWSVKGGLFGAAKAMTYGTAAAGIGYYMPKDSALRRVLLGFGMGVTTGVGISLLSTNWGKIGLVPGGLPLDDWYTGF